MERKGSSSNHQFSGVNSLLGLGSVCTTSTPWARLNGNPQYKLYIFTPAYVQVLPFTPTTRVAWWWVTPSGPEWQKSQTNQPSALFESSIWSTCKNETSLALESLNSDIKSKLRIMNQSARHYFKPKCMSAVRFFWQPFCQMVWTL